MSGHGCFNGLWPQSEVETLSTAADGVHGEARWSRQQLLKGTAEGGCWSGLLTWSCLNHGRDTRTQSLVSPSTTTRPPRRLPGGNLHRPWFFRWGAWEAAWTRKASKEAKKRWFCNRLADLQTAAASKDTRRLYAGIRSLAPKSKKVAVQLRDAQGCLQDASTQIEQLRTPPNSTLPLIPVHFLSAAKYVLCRSLKRRSCVLFSPCLHIRPHRLADILAPALATYTCQATRVPQLWKDAWITLVPKILRPLEPKNLRPIGLTEAGGRAIARILQGRLRPYVNQYLQSIPQFAYLTQRSTSHAILRVQSH